MKRRAPRMLVVAVVAVAAVAAAAVGSSASTPGVISPNSVSGTLKLLHSTSNQGGWNVLIPNFERVYGNVHVEAQFVSGGAAGQLAALLPQLQGGAGPDVFVIYPGIGVSPSVDQLQKAGYLERLSGRAWVKRDPAWIRRLTNVNGQPYMLELGIQLGAGFYNVDKFKELGLTAPKTFPGLLSLCRTVRQKQPSLTPIAYVGGQTGLTGAVLMVTAISDVYAKDPDWDTKRSQGKTTFASTPGWRHALEKVLAMKDAGCFAPSVAADTTTTTVAQMASGQALMTLGNSLTFGLIANAAPKIHFATMIIPGDTVAGSRMVVYPGSGIAVNARSSNKQAALAFLDFVARPKQNDVFNRGDGYGQIAPYNFNKADWPPLYKPLLPMANKIVTYPTYFWPGGSTFPTLSNGVQGLLTGQKTVDQVLADLDASWGK